MGGLAKPSIRKSPEFDSSESTTSVLKPLAWAALASKLTTVLFPLPPLPHTDIFIFLILFLPAKLPAPGAGSNHRVS
jgi:hypothetical protein